MCECMSVCEYLCVFVHVSVCEYVCAHAEAHPRPFDASSLWLFLSLMTASAVQDGAAGVDESEGPKCYEFSQGWLRHSEAEARFSGTISSMGSRKCVK